MEDKFKQHDTPIDPAFKNEEKFADKQWEKVKDETSGVDKTIEKKLEDDTITPKDLDTQGG